MNEDLANILHKQIIDYILNSSLNIQSIPDDIEREMYEKILDILINQLPSQKSCFKCISSCFKKKKE